MAKITFIGPSGQVNYQVGLEAGDPNLEPDKTYDLSDKLAKALAESSQMWKLERSTKSEDKP